MILSEIASKLGIPFIGDASFVIEDVSALEDAGSFSLCYIKDSAYITAAKTSRCGVLIVSTKHLSMLDDCLCSNFLITDHPQLVFTKAARLIHPIKLKQGIHPTALVSTSATIHSSAWIGPYVVIDDYVSIGRNVQVASHCYIGSKCQISDDTQVFPHVTILHNVHIGARCRVLSGAVIGSDGFGLVQESGAWVNVPHLGRVIIGNDVDIGANTTIDRGTLADTRIHDGVKIDNLVQIAHNVVVGRHSAIAGCAGLAGSSIVGEHCLLAGGVGLAGHLELADRVHITGMSMVTKSIMHAGVYSSGTPLDSNKQWRRNAARFKALDTMARRLGVIERRLGIDKIEED
ncbi:MAG: UDP-3-O-(3-hydroxymyristoyl)glucosamine N-acyltransferase [Halothiobacillaceae bacterium]